MNLAGIMSKVTQGQGQLICDRLAPPRLAYRCAKRGTVCIACVVLNVSVILPTNGSWILPRQEKLPCQILYLKLLTYLFNRRGVEINCEHTYTQHAATTYT